MSDDETGITRGVDARVSAGRGLLLVLAVLFWGFFLVRWAYEWFLAPALGMSPSEPFLPVDQLEQFADTVRGVAGPLGDFFAGTVEFVAISASSLPAVASGAWLTVVLTVVSIALGLVIAVPLAVGRVYGGRVTENVALWYTELIRGTPLLAQLFVLYFGLSLSAYIRELPSVGQGFVPGQAVFVALIGFTINSSAYQAEYIRSALLSVQEGQLTAARAIGLSKLDAIRHVVLPQGLRYAIPGWSNELIYLIKYSSLAAFITVPELYYNTQAIASDTFRYFELLVLAALVYLGMVLTASTLMGRFERAVSIPGLGQDTTRREQ